MNKYCVCFCRVSTVQQDLVQQTNDVTFKAEQLGYDRDHQIVIEFKESGITLSSDERMGIETLKREINKNPDIDCVICWELSRIARRADIIIEVRDFLVKRKIQWILLNPTPMTLLDETGEMTGQYNLILSMFTAFAESEMTMKKERFKRGKERNRQLGRYNGGTVQFGYRVDENGYLKECPKTSPIVVMMFKMYNTGNYTLLSLSREMKELGYFESFSTLPSIKTFLYKVLKQRNYYGDNNHPPIITKELFEKVQEKLSQKQTQRNICTVLERLGDRLLFDEEGYMLSYRNRKESRYNVKHKRTVSPIYCSHLLSGYRCSISQKTIDPFLWDISKGLYKKHLMNVSRIRKTQTEKMNTLKQKYTVCEKEIQEVQGKIDRSEERYINGKMNRERLNELIERRIEEKRELENKRQLLMEEMESILECVKQVIDNNNVDLDTLPFQDRLEIVRSVIERVIVRRPKSGCYWATLEVLTKVNNKVYQYTIYTPPGASKSLPKWEKTGVRERRDDDIKDVSRKWNHIPVIPNPKERVIEEVE